MATFHRREQLKHRWSGVDPQAPTYITYSPRPVLRSPICLGEGGRMLKYTGVWELGVPVADVRQGRVPVTYGSLPHAQ